MVSWVIICFSFLNAFSYSHLNGCKCWGSCSESGCISWPAVVNQVVFHGHNWHRTGESESSANTSMDTPRFSLCQRGLKPPGSPEVTPRNHSPIPSKSPKLSCLKANSHLLPWGRFWWHQHPAGACAAAVSRDVLDSAACSRSSSPGPCPAWGWLDTHLLFAQSCFVEHCWETFSMESRVAADRGAGRAPRAGCLAKQSDLSHRSWCFDIYPLHHLHETVISPICGDGNRHLW